MDERQKKAIMRREYLAPTGKLRPGVRSEYFHDQLSQVQAERRARTGSAAVTKLEVEHMWLRANADADILYRYLTE